MTPFEISTWVLAVLSLAGVILNVRKDKRCFYLWGVANVGWVLINLRAGIPAQAALFLIYFGLSVWGFFDWRRHEKLEAD